MHLKRERLNCIFGDFHGTEEKFKPGNEASMSLQYAGNPPS
jgi:hypothetical protein